MPGKMLDIWTWCLQNKFNLFIEKPLGVTLHQAQVLARLAEENGCITQVSFQRRSALIMKKIREACLMSGPITHAMVEFTKYDINPMIGERDRMLDDYVHAVDTARWICGGEVVGIESRCKRQFVPDINWIAAIIDFDNGSSCYVTASWTSGRRIFRAHMHGRGICGEVDPESHAWLYAGGDTTGERYDTQSVAGSSEFFVYAGFQNKVREFVDSIITGQQLTSSPFSDAVKTMEVCETILAQATIRKV